MWLENKNSASKDKIGEGGEYKNSENNWFGNTALENSYMSDLILVIYSETSVF